MGMKKFGIFGIALFVLVTLMVTSAFAAFEDDVDIVFVKLDGDELDWENPNIIDIIDRGEEFDIKVRVINNNENVTYEDIEIEAEIKGSHNDDVSDSTDTFDLKPNRRETHTLHLSLPQRMDQDVYRLRVRVEDKAGATIQKDYFLDIDTKDHLVVIKDVVLSPADTVMAGRALLATVRVKNYGNKDQKDVKVSVSIPELGVSGVDYIEELEGDEEEESASSEEIYLRIPACADAKDYTMYVEVEYDDGDKVVRTTQSVTVTEGDFCPGATTVPSDASKTVITVGATNQQIVKGRAGAIYPVTITNQGTSTATYTIGLDSVGDWAAFQMSPSNVLTVPSRGTSTVYVYASAKDSAVAGEHMFSVSVSKSGELLEQIPMKATVVDSAAPAAAKTGWAGLRKALEIALVVLVVLLVIFGLIVGFNKLKRGGEEEDEEGKTYY